MAEANAAAERKGELRGQVFSFISDISGRILGAVFSIFVICVAAYLAMHNHETTACVLGGATVVAIAAAIIKGSMSSGD